MNKYISILILFLFKSSIILFADEVKEFNETIPYDLDTLKIHNAARWQTEH